MNKFLLLLGVSGVGKSTIVQHLKKLDDKFVYISPYMTRPLREGETDKIPVSGPEMDRMEKAGEFVSVNELYAVKYGCPRKPIVDALEAGKYPVLDWPVDRLEIMEKEFPGRLYKVYIVPPSIGELRSRLAKDSRDGDGTRLRMAETELHEYLAGKYDGLFDYEAVSYTDRESEVAEGIYVSYLENRQLTKQQICK